MNNEITLNVRNFDSLLGQFIENVELGNFSAIECLGRFKEFENAIVKAKKCIEEQAIEEAEKHTEKTFKLGDFKVTKVEGRRMIDYSNIEEYQIAKANLKEIEDKYKQVALSSLTSLDESTGEILKRPIITFSKNSISIKNV
jgi:hypothetical protein